MTESISMIATNTNERRQGPLDKMPGHWVLARMGKRVLRPGGLELTRRLLAELAISPSDDVVEFAPGLGVTAHWRWHENQNLTPLWSAIRMRLPSSSDIWRVIAGSAF